MITRRMPRGRRALAVTASCAVLVAAPAAALWAAPAGPAGSRSSEAVGAAAPAPRFHDWSWPVPPPIRVLEPFRAPATPYSPGHRGVDLAAAVGSEVVASAAGVVHFAGWVGDRFLVAIDHGAGVLSSIEPVSPSVATETEVERGTPIGRVADGAHCEPGCVHFGVRVDGVYVSPFVLLGGLPRAVLLPIG